MKERDPSYPGLQQVGQQKSKNAAYLNSMLNSNLSKRRSMNRPVIEDPRVKNIKHLMNQYKTPMGRMNFEFYRRKLKNKS